MTFGTTNTVGQTRSLNPMEQLQIQGFTPIEAVIPTLNGAGEFRLAADSHTALLTLQIRGWPPADKGPELGTLQAPLLNICEMVMDFTTIIMSASGCRMVPNGKYWAQDAIWLDKHLIPHDVKRIPNAYLQNIVSLVEKQGSPVNSLMRSTTLGAALIEELAIRTGRHVVEKDTTLVHPFDPEAAAIIYSDDIPFIVRYTAETMNYELSTINADRSLVPVCEGHIAPFLFDAIQCSKNVTKRPAGNGVTVMFRMPRT